MANKTLGLSERLSTFLPAAAGKTQLRQIDMLRRNLDWFNRWIKGITPE